MELRSPDPYESVELLERALVLALRLSRFPEKPRGAKRLSAPAVELDEFVIQNQGRLRSLCKPAGTREVVVYDSWVQALTPSLWLGKPTHFQQRLGLLDLLWKAREKELDDLRLLPEPDERGRWVRAAPFRFGFDIPRWDALSDRDRRILAALSGRRMIAKELEADLDLAKGAGRKAVAPLVRSGILRRDGKDGYVIALIPLGSPPTIKPAS